MASEPEEIHIEDLQCANAFYYDSDGVKYYYFDIYNNDDGGMAYPEFAFTVVAKNKTAINGTYDILRGDCWRSATDVVEMDGTLPAIVTVRNVDDQGNYSMKGSFVGVDGIVYSFEAVVYVSAIDGDNDYADIILNESPDTTSVKDINGAASATHKILRNGQQLIIANEKVYRVNGRKIQ